MEKVQGLSRHISISIHALREEGDGPCKDALDKLEKFLSTPSARRATGRWSGAGR